MTCSSRACTHSVSKVALSNAFFSSACREWQDQLAMGLLSSGRGKQEERRKSIRNDNSWKERFYEGHWGTR